MEDQEEQEDLDCEPPAPKKKKKKDKLDQSIGHVVEDTGMNGICDDVETPKKIKKKKNPEEITEVSTV